MSRFLSLLILVPLAIVLVSFSVANREVVQVSFDPTSAANPAYAIDLPMFVIIFATLATGLIIGGIGTWFTQSKHRKLARMKKQEAAKWKFEAEKQNENVDTGGSFSKASSEGSFPIVPSSKAA